MCTIVIQLTQFIDNMAAVYNWSLQRFHESQLNSAEFCCCVKIIQCRTTDTESKTVKFV